MGRSCCGKGICTAESTDAAGGTRACNSSIGLRRRIQRYVADLRERQVESEDSVADLGISSRRGHGWIGAAIFDLGCRLAPDCV